jgi:hypothetical protein
MEGLTDEEYDALDEYYTENTIMPSGKPGTLSRMRLGRMFLVDDLCSTYLEARAEAEHTTPTALLNSLVRREIAATV